MAEIKIFNPEGMSMPKPYSHVARVKTQELVFIAGQTPIDATGAPVGRGDFEAQCEQVFANIHTALRSVNADWNNVVQFRTYILRPEHADAYRAWRGKVYPTMFPSGAYPPHTLLIISRLADEAYLLEVEAVAAL
ncbi:MAG TPA: RidA family protein [Xanthobacteraceae bacterium]|nr:RidA family protein [Xanthobacteraceae bacterium]